MKVIGRCGGLKIFGQAGIGTSSRMGAKIDQLVSLDLREHCLEEGDAFTITKIHTWPARKQLGAMQVPPFLDVDTVNLVKPALERPGNGASSTGT
jgi:hypothetical protein